MVLSSITSFAGNAGAALLVFMLINISNTVAAEQKIDEFPDTCQKAIDLIIENLDPENREILLSIDKEELKTRPFVAGWGKGIRDGFGLNEGNIELMRSCQALRTEMALHPVNTSGIIMEEVWLKLKR